eukprot:Hpha_TRINITY_DN3828_c0_g1::TRINITY_DN3828_c0_g1_i1::g.44602::m.44602
MTSAKEAEVAAEREAALRLQCCQLYARLSLVKGQPGWQERAAFLMSASKRRSHQMLAAYREIVAALARSVGHSGDDSETSNTVDFSTSSSSTTVSSAASTPGSTSMELASVVAVAARTPSSIPPSTFGNSLTPSILSTHGISGEATSVSITPGFGVSTSSLSVDTATELASNPVAPPFLSPAPSKALANPCHDHAPALQPVCLPASSRSRPAPHRSPPQGSMPPQSRSSGSKPRRVRRRRHSTSEEPPRQRQRRM